MAFQVMLVSQVVLIAMVAPPQIGSKVVVMAGKNVAIVLLIPNLAFAHGGAGGSLHFQTVVVVIALATVKSKMPIIRLAGYITI